MTPGAGAGQSALLVARPHKQMMPGDWRPAIINEFDTITVGGCGCRTTSLSLLRCRCARSSKNVGAMQSQEQTTAKEMIVSLRECAVHLCYFRCTMQDCWHSGRGPHRHRWVEAQHAAVDTCFHRWIAAELRDTERYCRLHCIEFLRIQPLRHLPTACKAILHIGTSELFEEFHKKHRTSARCWALPAQP